MDTSPRLHPARLRRVGLVLVTLSVLLAGCGGDDADQDAADAADADDNDAATADGGADANGSDDTDDDPAADDAGNDVSVLYSGGDSVDATAILADGTTWDRTEGGVLNVTEGPDGTVRMSIQMTERDADESEPMDVQLTCS